MKEYFGEGTLGDTYIITLKAMALGTESIKIKHLTKHTYWHREIREIYSISPNIEVEFVDKKHTDLIELTTDCHEQEMVFFPEFNIVNGYTANREYIVIQPHAGKDKGEGNNKEINVSSVITAVNQLKESNIVILGTKEKYKEVQAPNVINLINKTNILAAIAVTANAKEFIGPEGLLAFVSLSQKKKSNVFYASREAVERRIIGTPWEEYCNFVEARKDEK